MPRPDFLLTDAPVPGVQRLRARFAGHAYDLHRHETYAVGLTEAGIQAFRYRGVEQASTAGRTIVLHPDEMHDGHAVAPDGFVYRMVYVDAATIGDALGGRGVLPFVREAVADSPELAEIVRDAFEGFPGGWDALAAIDVVARLADALQFRAGHCGRPRRIWDCAPALERAREALDAATGEKLTAETLEALTGLDRYTLSRAFRARFGTAPHRYLVGRRLRRVAAAITAGAELAAAAAEHGFADQSHMTRHFKARFGMTPGRYARLLRGGSRIGARPGKDVVAGTTAVRNVVDRRTKASEMDDERRERDLQ